PRGFAFNPALAPALGETMPSLLIPRISVVDRVNIHPTIIEGRPVTFLHLLYRKDFAKENARERKDLWSNIADFIGIGPDRLIWKRYSPDSRLCTFGSNVPEKAIKHIAAFVAKKMPFEVRLEPVFDRTGVCTK